jgi:hypothetical protein
MRSMAETGQGNWRFDSNSNIEPLFGRAATGLAVTADAIKVLFGDNKLDPAALAC